jgi:hypothetical protein
MKILITGCKGLALALHECYQSQHDVAMVSRTNGYDIVNINTWGPEFLHFDTVFNTAYQDFDQVRMLEYFFQHWGSDHTKTIVSIGSRSIVYSRSDGGQGFWPYRLHKQALQLAHDAMQPQAKCQLKIFNPGPIDTDMVSHLEVKKLTPTELAQRIVQWTADPFVKRVDCWK